MSKEEEKERYHMLSYHPFFPAAPSYMAKNTAYTLPNGMSTCHKNKKDKCDVAITEKTKLIDPKD